MRFYRQTITFLFIVGIRCAIADHQESDCVAGQFWNTNVDPWAHGTCAHGTYTTDRGHGFDCGHWECKAKSGCGTHENDMDGSRIDKDSRCKCDAGYEQDGGACARCGSSSFKGDPGNYACVSWNTCTGNTEQSNTPSITTDRFCHCQAGYGYGYGSGCDICGHGTFKTDAGNGACEGCAYGKFITTNGATSCENWRSACYLSGDNFVESVAGTATADRGCHCAKGYGGHACPPCPVNTFKTEAGDGECTDCHANSIASAQTTGQSSDSCHCNSGYKKVGTVCNACGHGTYKTQAGDASSCSDCTAHSTTLHNAQTSNTCFCLKGYTLVDDTTQLLNGGGCEACVPGKYKTTDGSATCTACATNYYSTTEAATTADTCIPCDANAQAPEGSSEISDCICNAGYTAQASNDCKQCPSKYYSNTGEECTECPGGEFRISLIGSAEEGCGCIEGTYLDDGTTCTKCLHGSYTDTRTATECTNCPVGRPITLNIGSDSINDCVCERGFYRETSGICTQCVAGTYKDFAGDGGCTQCSMNYYSSVVGSGENTCIACGANAHTVSAGSTDSESCICGDGLDPHTCPMGHMSDRRICDDTTNAWACKLCPFGQYGPVVEMDKCYTCPGGMTTAGNGSMTVIDCVCTAVYGVDFNPVEDEDNFEFLHLLHQHRERTVTVNRFSEYSCVGDGTCIVPDLSKRLDGTDADFDVVIDDRNSIDGATGDSIWGVLRQYPPPVCDFEPFFGNTPTTWGGMTRDPSGGVGGDCAESYGNGAYKLTFSSSLESGATHNLFTGDGPTDWDPQYASGVYTGSDEGSTTDNE